MTTERSARGGNASRDQRRALVTGGSGVIGAAIVRHLALRGYEVVIHAFRNLRRAEQLASDIVAQGGRAAAVSFDVTDAIATHRALDDRALQRV